MTLLLFLIIGIFLLWAGTFAAYILVLTVVAAKTVGTLRKELPPCHRFMIVVPAHNESMVISECLESLLALDFPKNLFSILVVADNCSDETAVLSRRKNVLVYERTEVEHAGKGYALAWAVEKMKQEHVSFDALIVIDADSSVSKNFLRVLDERLQIGCDVIQTRYTMRNWDDNVLTRLAEIRSILFNHVLPLGRSRLGLSADLSGNGMCFQRKVLENVPWSAFSITEDVEYSRQLIIAGYKVVYAEDAQVVAQTPAYLKQARSQRIRCEFGRFLVFRKYLFPLLRMGAKRKSICAILDLSFPSFSSFLSVCGLGFFITVIAIFWFNEHIFNIFLISWSVILITVVLCVSISIYISGLPSRMYFVLLAVPAYIIWKNVVLIRGLFSNTSNKWIRTDRQPVDMEKISGYFVRDSVGKDGRRHGKE